MDLDRGRLEQVLAADHRYYGATEPDWRNDARLNLTVLSLLEPNVSAGMVVLDAGCGRGSTLLDLAGRFERGVGVDNDPDHIDLARCAAVAREVTNVEFLMGDFIDEAARPEWRGSFDLVFSERGPLGWDSRSIQAALHVLRDDGLVFCEVIGDLHHQEVREVFGVGPRFNQVVRAGDQVRVAMERNGVGVRIAADLISKRYYRSIYDWLEFQCDIWSWAGASFPSPDDARLKVFADRFTTSSGEVETTHHVVWVGGVKLRDPPGYSEHQHFACHPIAGWRTPLATDLPAQPSGDHA